MNMSESSLLAAQEIADKVTKALGGFRHMGREFFMVKNEVYFSELSPRPRHRDGNTWKDSKLFRI